MGVVRDVTIDQLTQAVQGISSAGMTDTTGQDIKDSIDALDMTAGTLGKDSSLQDINTTLQSILGAISPSYEDFTNSLVSYSNRVNITKKVLRKYNDGRVELFINGTVSSNLSSSQQTLFTITDISLLPDSYYVTGTASTSTNSLKGYFVNCPNRGNGYINVLHDGLNANDKITIQAIWYI